MVQLLASVLDVPLGERNAMLLAAGYAPAYRERALEAPELEHVRRALAFILKRQEPFPALVVDGGWNIQMTNPAAQRLFGLFRGPTTLSPAHSQNAMHMICHPDGIRRFMVNWEEFAGPLVQMIHRDAAAGGNPAAAELRDAILTYPGMPSLWRIPDPRAPVPPLLTMCLEKDGLSLSFFSTLTMLATPRDITLENLRIECFYPADAATEESVRRLVGAAG
jgi:hypothetical protein